MAEQPPNPLTSHLLNMVQGRQQTELAKIALLTSLDRKLSEAVVELKSIGEQLDEVLERTKGK